VASKTKIVDRDRGWAEMMKAVQAARGDRYAKVGVLADTAKGGMHEEGADLTVAEIAAVLEFGTEDGHIPERSFVRATFDEQREKLAEKARQFLVAVLFGKMTVDQALNAMGASLVDAIRKRVTDGDGVPPPNAPSTALAKAGTGQTAKHFAGAGGRARSLGEAFAQVGALAAVRTLVDTGRMLSALTWQIVSGRDKGE
jgi:hypothetical protein